MQEPKTQLRKGKANTSIHVQKVHLLTSPFSCQAISLLTTFLQQNFLHCSDIGTWQGLRGKCLALGQVEANHYGYLIEQHTSTALTSWYRNHHCLLLFGLPRSSTYHAWGCYDGTTTATSSAGRAHYKRASIYRLLVKKTKIVQIFGAELVLFASKTLPVTGPAHLGPSNFTFNLTG